MIINAQADNGKLELGFTPENDDPKTNTVFNSVFKTNQTTRMGSKRCEFHLPADWTLDSVHPDLLALATIAIIYPFCGSRIRVPRGVSKSFHERLRQTTNIRVSPVQGTIKPRQAPSHAVPALSYSGGIDSTAAVALLPEDTHLFYIDRLTQEGMGHTLLNQEAAHYACDAMADMGKNVHKIKTDMPYIRKPVGFNTYLTDSVPALLLADYYGLDTTGHGQTLEIGYQIGHGPYQECQDTEIGKPWSHLLEAVDMPFTLPTIGLSEVMTTQIARQTPYYTFAHACSRGQVHEPCMNCYKCFRKGLLDKTTTDSTLEKSYLDRLFQIDEVQKIIKQSPIYYENVLTYVTAHYNGNHPDMLALKKKTRGDHLQFDWMERWHPKAQALLAPKYRNQIKQTIQKYTKPMDTRDIKAMKQSYNEGDLPETEKATDSKKINILILVRRFDQLFPKHKVKYEFLQAIEAFANVTYHHDDGDILNILNKQPTRPDFIFHYDITAKHRLSPRINNLDKITIPVGTYVIDAHWQNELRRKYFRDNRISLIFSVSKHPFLERFPAYASQFRFLPFSINPDHIKDWQRTKDIDFLLMGHMADNYPFRRAVWDKLAGTQGFVYHKHPGHLEKDRSKLIIDDAFGQEINRAKIFFTCGSTYQYPVMKYFEVAGCNTLLIAEPNSDLKALGFQDGVHYIAANQTNFYDKALYYLKHDEERKAIAQEGYKLVHRHHTNRVRAKQFVDMIQAVI
ncbi:hypothetical protein GCM10028778_17210 [Barrientosiimonas marina]|uniref:DUF6395 domain-containing protein n=1 Tax=Lentibacillus kimchii TaxID=1542911 RepID=A0ABW2UU14_9BACI